MPAKSNDVSNALAVARDGDGEALAVLWRAYQPLLLRYLRGRGAREPVDLASQIWMDAARNLRRFRGDADDFRRWLFTIARRRLVDERRRAGRDMQLVNAVDNHVSSPGADDEFDAHDALTRALALVTRLPEQMRDAVLLRFVADLSVADAATVMGVRAGHVRVLTHRGLARLEQLLRDEGGEVVTLPGGQTIKGST